MLVVHHQAAEQVLSGKDPVNDLLRQWGLAVVRDLVLRAGALQILVNTLLNGFRPQGCERLWRGAAVPAHESVQEPLAKIEAHDVDFKPVQLADELDVRELERVRDRLLLQLRPGGKLLLDVHYELEKQIFVEEEVQHPGRLLARREGSLILVLAPVIAAKGGEAAVPDDGALLELGDVHDAEARDDGVGAARAALRHSVACDGEQERHGQLPAEEDVADEPRLVRADYVEEEGLDARAVVLRGADLLRDRPAREQLGEEAAQRLLVRQLVCDLEARLDVLAELLHQ